MLLPLKSNKENSKTGVTVQSMDLLGFLKLKATVKEVNVSCELKALCVKRANKYLSIMVMLVAE